MDRKLSKNAVIVKRIQITLILITLFFIFGGIAVFSAALAFTLSAITLILYIIAIFPFMKKWFNSYRFKILNDCIIIEKGVFVSKHICIFKSKIQYSDRIQTPLQRIFRTATVIYHTAGAAVYLSEIDEEFSDGAIFNEKQQTTDSPQ